MVLIFDLETNNILYTEAGKLVPELPIGTTEEKKIILAQEGKGFVGVAYEMDLEVFSYKVCFDANNNFVGLQPK